MSNFPKKSRAINGVKGIRKVHHENETVIRRDGGIFQAIGNRMDDGFTPGGNANS
ncbi:MAG: hypothetical protein ETSY2_45950 [Candidatus Entotheonella gemina]|uniref:Uncharacterized protein n=1 Tax=Candidatus Entotheonella gemina TaxID=1429439 RepID=W4LFC3_9BACT|nr:MAG: hypothetical protein ETSY2_45950 [Candidatus Entotheonella gemina]